MTSFSFIPLESNIEVIDAARIASSVTIIFFPVISFKVLNEGLVVTSTEGEL